MSIRRLSNRRYTFFSINPTIAIDTVRAAPTYNIVADAAAYNETTNNTITYTITTNYIVDGTTLYWSTAGSSNIVALDFIDNTLTGNVIIYSNGATVTRTIRPDSSLNESTEQVSLELRTDSTTGTIVASTSNVIIYDTSIVNYWISYLGGAGIEYGNGITVDNDKNIYIAGYSNTQTTGSYDAIVAKYNSNGAIQWQKMIGGTLIEYGNAIVADNNGSIYVTGYSSSTSTSSRGAILIKYNTSTGNVVWQRALGNSTTVRGNAIDVDSAGNIYVCGENGVSGAGVTDIFTFKYDSNGSLLWQRTLGGDLDDYGYGIAVDSTGSACIVGHSTSSSVGFSNDIVIAKYDTNGTLQWNRVLGTSGSTDIGNGVAVDSSDNFYICGYGSSTGASADIIIAKYNSSGILQWQRSYGIASVNNEYGYGVALDGVGGVYVCGYNGSNDIIIVKYDTDGTFQWARRINSSGNDYGYGIAADSSSFYIVGRTSSTAAVGSYDVILARLPLDGSLTGTYGAATYSNVTSSYVSNTSTLGDFQTTSGLFGYTSTLTSSNTTMTIQDSSFTSTTVQIP